jgi:hypothetical protein
MSRPAVQPNPPGETADQWWERVRAEHGPPPQQLRDLYQGIRSRQAQRLALADSTGGVS